MMHDWICRRGVAGYWYCRAGFWLFDALPWVLWRRRKAWRAEPGRTD
jgi:hypothetical protein